MSPGKHAADDRSFGRSASGAMVRGVVLIVVAVVLGIILLQATDGSDPFTAVEDDDSAVGAGRTTSTVLGAQNQTTTTAPANEEIDPSTITVLVANGSGGVAGLAGSLTEQVESAGYQTAPPANVEAVDASVVYYTTGFQEAAEAVASLFDPAPEVSPLPDPSPVDDLRAANVVLVASADLAPE